MGTIQVKCPGCMRTLDLSDRLAGKKSACPTCGTAVDVPAAQAVGVSGQAPLPAAAVAGLGHTGLHGGCHATAGYARPARLEQPSVLQEVEWSDLDGLAA